MTSGEHTGDTGKSAGLQRYFAQCHARMNEGWKSCLLFGYYHISVASLCQCLHSQVSSLGEFTAAYFHNAANQIWKHFTCWPILSLDTTFSFIAQSFSKVLLCTYYNYQAFLIPCTEDRMFIRSWWFKYIHCTVTWLSAANLGALVALKLSVRQSLSVHGCPTVGGFKKEASAGCREKQHLIKCCSPNTAERQLTVTCSQFCLFFQTSIKEYFLCNWRYFLKRY